MKYFYIYLFFLLSFQEVFAQETMGLFFNEPSSFNGYTLFSPIGYETTYLIDNCGEKVNEWTSQFDPGLMAYLLPDGRLLRSGRLGGMFNGGGQGGRVEIFSWDGNLEWGFNYAGPQFHAHHDQEYLPNGNILIIAWELKSPMEVVDAGRDPSALSSGGLWPDHILEIEPVGTNQANIVWEWHVWDHLIQDFDPLKDNFGDVSAHPERIDINYFLSVNEDWNHINGIDYNPELDQILLSVRDFHEIWVIDHSTTTSEAAGSTGGNSGKGGDLLYRYGNPLTYQRGTPEDRKFYFQHDAQWVAQSSPNEGMISIFNNGLGRPEGTYSTVDLIAPPVNPDGSYSLADNSAFGPDTLLSSFVGSPPEFFFSPNISGATYLPNGNVLACLGATGRFLEIDDQGNYVWAYTNPVNSAGPMDQGTAPFSNSVFKIQRYAPDYSAFSGKVLTPQGPLENNPFDSDCVIYDQTTSVSESLANRISVFPNPVHNYLYFSGLESPFMEYRILDISGITLKTGKLEPENGIEVNFLPSGLFFIQLIDSSNKLSTFRFVKF